MKNKCALLIAAVAALPVAVAQAEEVALEEVFVTATRMAEPIAEGVGNRALINSEQLKLNAHDHIQQVLNQLPGVDFSRNNGQEYLPAIRSPALSGAGACGSVLMAEDGIPLRPAGFCNINELFEAHSEQAQSIEVIRGPANALFGSNALHGVVNVIGPAAFERAVTLRMEGGPDDFGRLQFAWGDTTKAVAFTGSHENSFREAAGVDQQKLSLGLRSNFESFKVTTGITAVNLNQETAGYIEGTDAYTDDDLIKTNPNPEAYRDAKALRLWSRFEAAEQQPGWVVTPYVRYSEMAFLQHFLPGQPLEENGQSSIGLQSAFYFYGDHSQVIAGLDLEYTQGWLEQYQASATVGSAFLQATIPAGYQYDYDVDATQAAPFVQWQWLPNESWKFTAGLRYENMRYDYDNQMVDGRTREDGSECGFGGCRYTRPADRADTFNNWSPSLGALYHLGDNHQLFATLARGFRAPQTSELYRLQRAQTVAELDSEQLDSLELGVRGSVASLRYELVAYAMHKDNLIFRDSDYFYVNDGETSHQGIELALAYRVNEHWDMSLAATSARHRYDYSEILSGIDIDGNDVDTAPRHFGVAKLGWNITARARTELEWEHMGSYYTDPENLHQYEGHDVANLRARWQVLPSLTLSAKVLNLFDTEYAKRADYTTFSGDRYFPGQPRSFYFAAEYSW
ncbi:TonB-dependent receptor [Halioxenophilus sp. WMMB6]|uniref:TonB-dependent receptor n=1 Tax=Halioxenophilus sp. WMMB6 TaxID=3073815 RepID=UPI00295EF762|nr:TonB-dependent receptor [Halioxenophilus sp. WMMB6]